MSGKPNAARKTKRRQATIEEIVAAAWDLAAEQGLVGISMRDLGARVGMRAQSLYSYFGSKNDIYDAMFADGNRAFLEMIDASAPTDGDGTDSDAHLAAAARAQAHLFFNFCAADPVRHQLMFQRTIPGFEPSESSYALAAEAYESGLSALRALGLSQDDLDLATGVMSGLVSQQLANEPGGDRWERLLDRAIDMLLAEIAPQLPTETRRTQ